MASSYSQKSLNLKKECNKAENQGGEKDNLLSKDVKYKPFLINFELLGPDLAIKILVECKNSNYLHRFEVISSRECDGDCTMKVIIDYLHPIYIEPINLKKDQHGVKFLARDCFEAIKKFTADRLQIPDPQNDKCPLRINITANICSLEYLENLRNKALATSSLQAEEKDACIKTSVKESFVINYNDLTPALAIRVMHECNDTNYVHKFKIMNSRKYEESQILKIISNYLYPLQIKPFQFTRTPEGDSFLAKNCLDIIMELITNKLQINISENPQETISFSIIANYCPLESVNAQLVTTQKEFPIAENAKKSFMISYELLSADLIAKVQEECNDPNYLHKFKVNSVKKYKKDEVLKIIYDFLDPIKIEPIHYTKDKKRAVFFAKNCLDAIMKLISNKLQIPTSNAVCPLVVSITANFCPEESLGMLLLNDIAKIGPDEGIPNLTYRKIYHTSKKESFLINYKSLGPNLVVKVLSECNNPNYIHQFKVLNAGKYEKDWILKLVSDFLHPIRIVPSNFRKQRKHVFFSASNCLDAIMKMIDHRLETKNPLDEKKPVRFTILTNVALHTSADQQGDTSLEEQSHFPPNKRLKSCGGNSTVNR